MITATTTRARLLTSSMITGVAMAAASTGAHAAEAAAAADTTATVQEFVVTGSRIPQPNLTSVSPLTVVSSAEVKFTGAVAVESLLQNLPSVIPEYNQGVDNGATGTATVSLRGLGSKRTLVLVNGNRLMPGDPQVPSPDLNNIPAALIDRVEVITGGASAVYGSDAVAGVVNFVMKKDFEGVRVDAQYGFAMHDNGNTFARNTVRKFDLTHASNPIPLAKNSVDGMTYTATLILGANSPDGKGNITAYAGYRNIQPITQDKRDAGACGISSLSSTSNTYDTQVCQGSSNSAFGKFVLKGGKFANDPAGSGNFVPFSGKYAFNFGPFNYYQQHDELYTGGYYAHYEINPMFEVYSDLMFADDNQISQAAPSGLFSNSGPIFAINCANPFLSADQQNKLCVTNAPDPAGVAATGISDKLSIGYRFVGVPRVTDLKHEAYTIGTGLRGKLGSAWSYDLRMQYGKTTYTEIFNGDVSLTKIKQALLAVAGSAGPVCIDPSGGCVPLNIFQPLGKGFTPAAIKFVTLPAVKAGGNTEQVVNFSLTGDLGKYGFKSPLAHDGVGVAFGAEYRRETLSLTVDNSFGSGDLSGAGGVNPPASGVIAAKEVYGEVRVPLAQDAPFAKDLSLEAGYRYASVDIRGAKIPTNTYKISGQWAPISDIRFRAGFNRAVRTPNIVELFTPRVVGNNSINDPCANDTGVAPVQSLAACMLTGVSAPGTLNAPFGVYGNIPTCAAAQCSSLTGGTPDLKPEKANTYTVGAVIQPRFIPGLSLTIDYFKINIDKPITTYGASVILGRCFAGDLSFCALVHRAPTTGALFGITLDQGYVIDPNVNSGSIKTSGLDFGASYRLHLSAIGAEKWGTLDFTFNGTYTHNFTTQPLTGGGSYDCVGLFGPVCGEPESKFKSQTRVTWNSPWNLALSLNWRYLSAVGLDQNQSNPFLATSGAGFLDTIDGRIPGFHYFDVSATYRLKDRYTLRAGMNNIFDRDPPVLDANNLGIAGTSGFGNGNTFPGVYDAVGRSVFVGITADF